MYFLQDACKVGVFKFLRSRNIFGINNITDEDSASSHLIAQWNAARADSNISHESNTLLNNKHTNKSYGSVGSHH
jgi:hypothetical protein